MIHPHEKEHPFTRVVVEKPIGSDLASASEINAELARHFDEGQIFRIDHYLGKETVENLMVLRFANAIFEPIWTARFVDHVQITVAEAEGVGTRAAYYDHAGALRDMVQSHLLQTLCMIATEPPNTTGAESMRDAKLDVLRALRPLGDEDIEKRVVRGQYGEGLIGGRPVKAYRARGARRAGLANRNLRRAAMLDRQLAMGRRAVLPAHRKAAAQALERDCDLLQQRAPNPV